MCNTDSRVQYRTTIHYQPAACVPFIKETENLSDDDHWIKNKSRAIARKPRDAAYFFPTSM